MLALGWYQPMEDLPPVPPAPPRSAELSRRLQAAFDNALHCDLSIGGIPVHRVVLRRNPHLNLDGTGATEVCDTAGISDESLRTVLRAHYLDYASFEARAPQPKTQARGQLPPDPWEIFDPWAGSMATDTAPKVAMMSLFRGVPQEERSAIEAAFGPLDQVGTWAPLHKAFDTRCFSDCTLVMPEGRRIPAHKVIVCGVDDGHFFEAALRWPGASESATNEVKMPDGLSHEALQSLLRMRYGSGADEVDRILEARHFSELLDWPDVQKQLEDQLEGLLADARNMDGESLLAVMTHAEESVGMPPRLKAAALAAAVRQWSKVANAAGESNSIPQQRQDELKVLSGVQRRNGHVCGNLEEYLHAAADDLIEWEFSLSAEATVAATRGIEVAWKHWQDLIFEFGAIHGAQAAEAWRKRIRDRRERLRTAKDQSRGNKMPAPPPGRVWFVPTCEWREVPQNAICPAGLEYRFDLQTGKNYAKICV